MNGYIEDIHSTHKGRKEGKTGRRIKWVSAGTWHVAQLRWFTDWYVPIHYRLSACVMWIGFPFFVFSLVGGVLHLVLCSSRGQMAFTWREFLKWKIYKKKIFPYRPSLFCYFLSSFKRTDTNLSMKTFFVSSSSLKCYYVRRNGLEISYIYIRVDF